ncbi:MAG TPA: Sec-independent protein translocase protein TatB [Thermodesulfobacteriota bacterium]|nr:Sec-independent protein translocase protein TatB [Thermodesulfobacteriota bacterium]
MFGIGTSEILIILVIALLVLGPKEIPKIARTLGRGMRELERAKNELKSSIEFEINEEDAKQELAKREAQTEEAEAAGDGAPLDNPTSNSRV